MNVFEFNFLFLFIILFNFNLALGRGKSEKSEREGKRNQSYYLLMFSESERKKICLDTMATVHQLLFIWVTIYSQIRLYMQNILILIITYYRITNVIIKITDQNIVIWE